MKIRPTKDASYVTKEKDHVIIYGVGYSLECAGVGHLVTAQKEWRSYRECFRALDKEDLP